MNTNTYIDGTAAVLNNKLNMIRNERVPDFETTKNIPKTKMNLFLPSRVQSTQQVNFQSSRLDTRRWSLQPVDSPENKSQYYGSKAPISKESMKSIETGKSEYMGTHGITKLYRKSKKHSQFHKNPFGQYD